MIEHIQILRCDIDCEARKNVRQLTLMVDGNVYEVEACPNHSKGYARALEVLMPKARLISGNGHRMKVVHGETSGTALVPVTGNTAKEVPAPTPVIPPDWLTRPYMRGEHKIRDWCLAHEIHAPHAGRTSQSARHQFFQAHPGVTPEMLPEWDEAVV